MTAPEHNSPSEEPISTTDERSPSGSRTTVPPVTASAGREAARVAASIEAATVSLDRERMVLLWWAARL
jgi:hypothetical protein